MDDERQMRRYDDLRDSIRASVADAMTVYRLTTDRLDQDIQRLKFTVFGDQTSQIMGLVGRLDKIEASMREINHKLETLIDASQARDNQFLGAKKAFYVLSAIAALLGGPPAIANLLKTFGVTP